MTRTAFIALCLELTIDPAIALLDEDVKSALAAGKSAEEIRAILEENF
jgi:ABC-type iron transport system FetAB ATPase subunit